MYFKSVTKFKVQGKFIRRKKGCDIMTIKFHKKTVGPIFKTKFGSLLIPQIKPLLLIYT